jgi:hypothetical protein
MPFFNTVLLHYALKRRELLSLRHTLRSLVYFRYFENMKEGLRDHLAVCVSVYPPLIF